MKKALGMLLSALLLVFGCLPVFAASPVHAPEVTLFSRERTASDDTFTFSFSCEEALTYEENRALLYASLSRTFSDAELSLTDSAWVLYPVRLLTEAGRNGQWVSVRLTSPADGSLTLSLTRDILPALKKGGLYTHDAFDYRLRFSVVAETDVSLLPLSDETEAGPYTCPETAAIDFVVPEGTLNPNTAFPFLPYGDLTLLSPTHPGCVFGGWKIDGTYVDTIPGNTMDLTVEGVFTPRTFAISYVLTTRPGPFVYVNNQENPRAYVYGSGERIYSLVAPSGYVFAGWYRDAAFSGKPLLSVPKETVGDLVLYARWLTEEEYENELASRGHWGDLDADGEITASDARLCLRAAVGLETLSGYMAARADFDNKGHLTAGDARTVLRLAVGLDALPDVLRRAGRIE